MDARPASLVLTPAFTLLALLMKSAEELPASAAPLSQERASGNEKQSEDASTHVRELGARSR